MTKLVIITSNFLNKYSDIYLKRSVLPPDLSFQGLRKRPLHKLLVGYQGGESGFAHWSVAQLNGGSFCITPDSPCCHKADSFGHMGSSDLKKNERNHYQFLFC